jgi:uncharacterized protein (DUF1778 family)
VGGRGKSDMAASIRDATLDLRVTEEQKELIRRAAALRGQTMTEFVLAAVEPLARSLVERQQVIELNEAAWQAFVRLAEAQIPAPPLAKREAAAFLSEMGGQPDSDERR